MSTATATATTAKRNATITNNRADLHQFFTVPTGILATSSIARAIVSALTKADATAADDIFHLTGSNDFADGFIYRMPQGGNDYTAIEIKRYGPARTSITLIARHYSPNQEVLDHRIIAREFTLDHFITYLNAHAK